MPDAPTLQGKSPAHMVAALLYTHSQAIQRRLASQLVTQVHDTPLSVIVQRKESFVLHLFVHKGMQTSTSSGSSGHSIRPAMLSLTTLQKRFLTHHGPVPLSVAKVTA